MSKPIIFYVDDEPHNLTVFEASISEAWQVYTFDNPLNALNALDKVTPWVIISDQRMPGVTGVNFLELTRKVSPNSIRIIVTGYSDENLVVESVRKAQVFDYIRKPWDIDELEKSLNKAIEIYKINEESRRLQEALKEREAELQKQTVDLLKMTSELEKSIRRETSIRSELECWVPPFVLWALHDNKIKFPIRKDLVCINFDIIESSKIHDIYIENKPIRSLVIQTFSEAIIKHGGWRESHSGDSAYGHFGLLEDKENPFEAALAVAREFRVALRGISAVNKVEIECGIALHLAKNSLVDVHTVQINSPRGVITQKSFDTTSSGVDMLHRIEKVAHNLPGSNIIISEDFLKNLREKPQNIIDIGKFNFKGQTEPIKLFIIPSDRVTENHIEQIRQDGIDSNVNNLIKNAV